jgi:hypothetical protein
MPVLAAMATALAVGAAPAGAVAARSAVGFPRAPDLAVRLAVEALGGPGTASLGAAPGDARPAPPPCTGDVCQPVVSVPGFEPRYGRVHRSELFVAALERAHVEPLASLAWAFVSTGLRLDWTPRALDGPNVDARGWGSVMLRLRVRLDAGNHLVFPRRRPPPPHP